MKKLLVLVLLVPIFALTMISCDADMRSSLAGFMGGLGGNVYEDAGLIVVNTAQAEAASTTVAAIGTGANVNTVPDSGPDQGTTSGMGVKVTVTDGTKLLAPQPKAKQDELKSNLGDAFNSGTQKAKLIEDLKKPAGAEQKEAAKGTITVFNKTLDELEGKLTGDPDLKNAIKNLKLPDVGDGSGLTQGDLLTLQLMTDLISNTVGALNDIGGGGADGAGLGNVDPAKLQLPANRDKVLSIIDDALFAAEVAAQISGAASIDFTGQIDLGDLMDGLGKGTRSRGDSIELTDAEDFIGTINNLAPTIVELMGITYVEGEFVYDDPDKPGNPKYLSFLLNQQVYRASTEQALTTMRLSGLTEEDVTALNYDISNLVMYALSVFVTEHDAFWLDEKEADTLTPGEMMVAYLNATEGEYTNKKLGLGTLTKNDKLIQPDISGNVLDYNQWPAFLADRDKPYYKAILNNLIMISEIGGIAQLTTELEKFRDAAKDGFDSWYDSLADEIE